MTHDLCDAHADRLSVPRGWQLEDRRIVAPSAVPPARTTPSSPAERRPAEPPLAAAPIGGVAARPSVRRRWGLGDVAVGSILVAARRGALTRRTDDADDERHRRRARRQRRCSCGSSSSACRCVATRAKGNGARRATSGLRFRPVDARRPSSLGVVLQAVRRARSCTGRSCGCSTTTTDDVVRRRPASWSTRPPAAGIVVLVLVVVLGAPVRRGAVLPGPAAAGRRAAVGRRRRRGRRHGRVRRHPLPGPPAPGPGALRRGRRPPGRPHRPARPGDRLPHGFNAWTVFSSSCSTAERVRRPTRTSGCRRDGTDAHR